MYLSLPDNTAIILYILGFQINARLRYNQSIKHAGSELLAKGVFTVTRRQLHHQITPELKPKHLPLCPDRKNGSGELLHTQDTDTLTNLDLNNADSDFYQNRRGFF